MNKQKVVEEIDNLTTKIDNLREEKHITANKQETLTKNFQKNLKILYIVGGISICLCITCAVIAEAKSSNFFEFLALVFFVFPIVNILGMNIMMMLNKRAVDKCKKTSIDIDKEIAECSSKRDALYPKWRGFVITELCMQFNITPAQFEFDITPILNQHPELREWWTSQEKIEVVVEALTRKYKRTYNELEKSDLEVQNLKLQNESIKIDNTQKKFWTCAYCGNYNPGLEMSCIKCGAARRIDNE